MLKVRLKTTEQEAAGFLCTLIASALGRELEDCEARLRSEGYIELELEPHSFRTLEEKIRKYSFFQMEVLTEVRKTTSVTVRLRGQVSPELACNILSGILGYRVDGCVEVFSSGGELKLSLSPELTEKLLSSAKAYPFLEIKLEEPLSSYSSPYRGMPASGGAFEKSWSFLKRNAGFFALYGVVFVLLLLLSMVPFVGLVFSILTGLLGYSVLLYVAVSYLGGRTDGLEFRQIPNYVTTSTGLYIGSLVLMLVAVLLSLLLFLIFGGLGALHDAIYEMESSEGLITSLGVYLILLILVSMYYFYTIPLIYARVLLRGMDFGQGFLAVFYPFTPTGFKEAFSNSYLKKAGLWFVVVSIAVPLAIIASITIILLPVGIVLLLWLLTYTAITVAEHVSESYKMSL